MISFKSIHWPFARRKEFLGSRTTGYLFLGVMLVAGPTFTPFAKSLTTVFSPLSLLFIGETMILLFILLSFGALRIAKGFARLHPRDIPPLITLGLFATSGLLLLFTGLQTTKAASAELFTHAELVFLILLAALILKEPLKREHAIGGSVMTLGIALVALRGFTEALTFRQGDMLILAGGLSFGFSGIVFKRYLSHLQPELALFCRSSMSVLTFFILSPFIEHTIIKELKILPTALLPALVGFGFLSRFINILSFYQAARRLPITTISLILPFGIIIAILFAHLYLGEQLHWFHFFGAALIILGSILIHLIGIHPSEKHAEIHLKQHHRHHL